MQSNPGKIVTKYQFSYFVYPFSPKAIDCGVMSSSTIDDHGNICSARDRESGGGANGGDGGGDNDGDDGGDNDGGEMAGVMVVMVMWIIMVKMAVSFLLIKNYSFSGDMRAMTSMILST